MFVYKNIFFKYLHELSNWQVVCIFRFNLFNFNLPENKVCLSERLIDRIPSDWKRSLKNQLVKLFFWRERRTEREAALPYFSDIDVSVRSSFLGDAAGRSLCGLWLIDDRLELYPYCSFRPPKIGLRLA